PVAVLARDLDRAGQLADLLDEVARDRAGMKARATRDDVHVLGAPEYLGRRRAECGLEQLPVGDALLECVRDRARLFVDLLEHEMPVLTLFGRIRGELALADGTLDSVAVAIEDSDGCAANLGDVTFFKEHEAPRHRQQRRNIGGDEVLLDTEPHDDGAPLPSQNDAVRIALAHDGERIGAFELGDGCADRLEQIAYGLEMAMHAMGDHLGIRLRGELVTAALELGAQLLMVLDDAVMNDRESVARDVRMGIALARHAVGRPARVRDAELAVRRIVIERVLQRLHLADGAQALELVMAVDHGDPSRVVAAIFEPAQALHQNGNYVALGNRSDDSTHLGSSRRLTRGLHPGTGTCLPPHAARAGPSLHTIV